MASKQQSTREKAAAARAAAESSERRRENMVRLGIAAGVLLIVVGIIGGALWSTRNGGSGTSADGPVPTGAAEPQYGVPVGTATAPTLDIYEDFQCPACAQTEAMLGSTIRELAASGQVKLNYHPMNFLDAKLGNDSSTQAAAAFGCAVDQGKTQEYHDLVFANHPATEGDGFTGEQLKGWGAESGLSGPQLDAFNTCFDEKKYEAWPTMVNAAASDRGVTGTPTFYLDDEQLDMQSINGPEAFKAKVLAAAGGQ